jgi:hypothetical protein
MWLRIFKRIPTRYKSAGLSSGLQKPIFITGAARSGTTFLGSQLGKLPDIIHCPFELKDIWSNVGKVPMASPKTRDRVNPPLYASDVKPGQANALSRAFLDRMQKIDPRKAKREGYHFLNKNPHLANKIGLVNALFPDSIFIWIYRPLVQVVASLKMVFADIYSRQMIFHAWPDESIAHRPRGLHIWIPEADPEIHPRDRLFPGGNVKWLAEYWLESNIAIRSELANISESRQIHVDHSDIVNNPEKAFERLCRFLNQPVYYAYALSRNVKNTNKDWKTRLDRRELHELKDFCESRWKDIQVIFPRMYRNSADIFY